MVECYTVNKAFDCSSLCAHSVTFMDGSMLTATIETRWILMLDSMRLYLMTTNE